MAKKTTIVTGCFETREELENKIMDLARQKYSFNQISRNCEISPNLAIKIWRARLKEEK